MILPVEKPHRIILSEADLPKIEHTSSMRVVRAKYLEVIWELAIDIDSNAARLSCITVPGAGNTEISSLIAREISLEDREISNPQLGLERLINEYSHRDFVLSDSRS